MLGLRHREPEREEMSKTRAALAMCENIDWNVGRVLDKLDEADGLGMDGGSDATATDDATGPEETAGETIEEVVERVLEKQLLV